MKNIKADRYNSTSHKALPLPATLLIYNHSQNMVPIIWSVTEDRSKAFVGLAKAVGTQYFRGQMLG